MPQLQLALPLPTSTADIDRHIPSVYLHLIAAAKLRCGGMTCQDLCQAAGIERTGNWRELIVGVVKTLHDRTVAKGLPSLSCFVVDARGEPVLGNGPATANARETASVHWGSKRPLRVHEVRSALKWLDAALAHLAKANPTTHTHDGDDIRADVVDGPPWDDDGP